MNSKPGKINTGLLGAIIGAAAAIIAALITVIFNSPPPPPPPPPTPVLLVTNPQEKTFTPQKTIDATGATDVTPIPGNKQPAIPTGDVPNPFVYITHTGKKYHRDYCLSLQRSKKKIRLSEAKRLGYSPCSRCKPPQ